jgi:hypothetical protein
MLDLAFDLRFRGLHLFGKTGFAEIFFRIAVDQTAIDGNFI